MRGDGARAWSAAACRGFSLEDVAAEAGVSRTTIYRYFPGAGHSSSQETATWEVGRFWARLGRGRGGLEQPGGPPRRRARVGTHG